MSDKEILVVVSKLKSHVKSAHGLSTSSQVPGVLTEIVSKLCSKAAEKAKGKGRKTVMDRDFDAPEGSTDSLVVVSKLKTHIKNNYGLSTSSQVPGVLSAIIAKKCAKAAENALAKKRKTIMDRDFVCETESSCCSDESSCCQ